MPNKYELIKIAENRYKIKATKSFTTITGAKINVGQFGGEVGSPNVLSQEGRCWIFANVKLSENCIVDGNACIMHSSVAPDASVKLHGNVIVTKCKFDVCSEVELFSGNYKRTAFAGMFSGFININGTVSHCLFASKHTTTIEITSSGKLSFFNCIFESKEEFENNFFFDKDMSVFKNISSALFTAPEDVIFGKSKNNNLYLLEYLDLSGDTKLILCFDAFSADTCLFSNSICDLISKLPVSEYTPLPKNLQKLLSDSTDAIINKMKPAEIPFVSFYSFLCSVIGDDSLLSNKTKNNICTNIFKIAKINIKENKLVSFDGVIDKNIINSIL